MPTALAIILTGATYTPYDSTSGRAPLQHKMKISEPKYFVTTETFWKSYGELLESSETVKTFLTLDDAKENLISVKSLISKIGDVDVNSFEPTVVQGQVDRVLILYSSGTTGMPKGDDLTHLNCILYVLPHEPTYKDECIKSVYVTGDWFHNYDFFMTYKMLALGKKVVYTTDISPKALVMAFHKAQVNFIFVEPSIVNLLTKVEISEGNSLQSLYYVFCAASPIHEKIMKKLQERFTSIKYILQGYGMTETWELTSSFLSTKGQKIGIVGSITPCIALKIENPETREALGPNEIGQVCVKIGPRFMKGYTGIDPSSYVHEGGWFKTGDLGYYDNDHYFFIVGRDKEIIDYDGWKVAPLELETILMLHPGVREVGVVGKPVPIYGEEPTAFVVRQPNSDVTEQELVDFVAAEVAPYMRLRGGVRFISQLPKNPRGKILRRELKEMLNNN